MISRKCCLLSLLLLGVVQPSSANDSHHLRSLQDAFEDFMSGRGPAAQSGHGACNEDYFRDYQKCREIGSIKANNDCCRGSDWQHKSDDECVACYESGHTEENFCHDVGVAVAEGVTPGSYICSSECLKGCEQELYNLLQCYYRVQKGSAFLQLGCGPNTWPEEWINPTEGTDRHGNLESPSSRLHPQDEYLQQVAAQEAAKRRSAEDD